MSRPGKVPGAKILHLKRGSNKKVSFTIKFKIMNKIKKMGAGIMMFVFAIALVFTQSAFKNSRASQTWVFTGTATSQITNANYYSQSAPVPNNCQSSRPLPCKLILDESVNTQQALTNFMSGKTSSQIVNNYAVGTRD
jgi:hypothetical protein